MFVRPGAGDPLHFAIDGGPEDGRTSSVPSEGDRDGSAGAAGPGAAVRRSKAAVVPRLRGW